MTREETLDKAKECVCGSREEDYGGPEKSFEKIAALWSAYLDYKFTPLDVGMMLALLKVGRIAGGRVKDDSFVDLAGYAACAAEITTESADSKGESDYDLAELSAEFDALCDSSSCGRCPINIDGTNCISIFWKQPVETIRRMREAFLC